MIDILVGPVASGKSTYSAMRAKTGSVIVSTDAIILAVHGGEYDLYNPGLKPLYKSIQSHMIHTAVIAERNVVIDDTNLTVATRSRFVQIAKSLDVDYRFVVFKWLEPIVHASRRYRHDSRGIGLRGWREIIQSHKDRFEPLTENESKKMFL